MKPLFALAIFFSATLLFMAQPLVAKILLPELGGSPAVWSTCMVFFQAALLLGYVYAHVLSRFVSPRWQRPVHAALLLAASLTLPLPIEIGNPGDGDPRSWLLQTLGATVGLPFFALSTTAPLLQQWFSRTGDPKARDPYFLYAASNAGSLLGLLGYLVLEPFATRNLQAHAWSIAFWILTALLAACAYASRTGTAVADAGRAGLPAAARSAKTAARNRVLWIVLSLVPSALLLGVTQHLATDVVSAPFLWVLPLALYLVTFIAAFSTPRPAQGRRARTPQAAIGGGHGERWGTIAPFAVIVVLVLSLAEIRYPILLVTAAHLALFTVLSMLCHTRLAESRPDPSHLTEYFVCVSLGGVLGGAIIAFLAPAIFSSILEYPLAIAAAILLRPQTIRADRRHSPHGARWAWRAAAAVLFAAGYWGVAALNERVDPNVTVIRAALAVPAIFFLFTSRTALLFAGTAAGLLAGASVVRTGGDVLHRERTFFGVHEVTSQQNGDWHVLTHGTTTHGVQALRGKLRFLPTAYYHPTGPVGDVIFALTPDGRFRDVAVVGLGAGALAAYAGSGVRMDFLEIDEAVIRIAENPEYFTYLSDARARAGATIHTKAVDGRLGLRAMPASSYDLIVIDAFSSDAIPTHLLTREAMAMFSSRLKPRGVIAFHVSNRFFDLGAVIARAAAELGMVSYIRDDRDVPPERAAEAMRPSVWVAAARADGDLGGIPRSAPRWSRLSGSGIRLWTDDYTNVLGALQD